MAPKRVYTAVVTETEGQTTLARLAAKLELKKELRAKLEAEGARMKGTRSFVEGCEAGGPAIFPSEEHADCRKVEVHIDTQWREQNVRHRADRRFGRHQ